MEDTTETVKRPKANRQEGQRAIGRKDPKSTFGAGVPISWDGTPGHLKLKNRDPNKEYVLVYRGGERTNFIPNYEALGFEIEQFDPDHGVKLGAGRKTSRRKGDEIEWAGHVLMSIDKEEYERIKRFGPDGITGTNLVDQLEKRIRGRQMHREAFREERIRGVHEDARGSRVAQEDLSDG